jgi:hypothetical protein
VSEVSYNHTVFATDSSLHAEMHIAAESAMLWHNAAPTEFAIDVIGDRDFYR